MIDKQEQKDLTTIIRVNGWSRNIRDFCRDHRKCSVCPIEKKCYAILNIIEDILGEKYIRVPMLWDRNDIERITATVLGCKHTSEKINCSV